MPLQPTTCNLQPDSDVLIRVSGVSKKFCLSLKKSLWYGLKDMGNELVGRRHGGHGGLRPKEFWAVKDVSFELRRGECLGLIGRNGAGKTTLLKMLNGLIKPDAGRITMRGRVGALIALGAGFNPILTGRENIYVNASVLGLTKREIDAKMDEIIDFAEIGDFMDTPVQNYSSGMAVRLGFAVASSFEPDILLLDEVLAVGDEGFRHKCYSRISAVLKKAAVIFVTHSMDYVGGMCTSAVRMFKGQATYYPDPADAIEAYRADNNPTQSSAGAAGLRVFYPPIRSADVALARPRIAYGEDLEVVVDLDSAEAVEDVVLAVYVRNRSDHPVLAWHTSQFDRRFDVPRGKTRLRIPIGPVQAQAGDYLVSFFLMRKGQVEHLVWFWNQLPLKIVNPGPPVGNVPCLLPFRGMDLQVLDAAAPPGGG